MAETLNELVGRARDVQARAYAPYSGFRVGAVLETGNGVIYSGCNVENASFAMTMCAERVAIGTAVAAGDREFTRLVLVTDADAPASPCGACRQVISEFAPELEIISVAPDGAQARWQASALLPARFDLQPSPGTSA